MNKHKVDKHRAALEKLARGTVIPAHPLALTAERKLDERRQRALSKYYLAAGAGGLAVGVHTTQFAIREPEIDLFKPVLELAAAEAEAFAEKTDEVIVNIAGVCGDFDQALKEAELAKELNYDAVLLSPGGLNHLSEEQMVERTREVASILPVVGFYLQPSVGGRLFSFNYWQQICELENVVAIKSAPFNRYQTIDVVRAAALSSRAEQIALYTGNDDHIILDLLTKYRFEKDGEIYEKRFVGGLLGQWAIWTKKAVEIFNQIKEVVKKETLPADLLTLSSQLTDANAAVFDVANNFQGCIAGIHEILRRQGLMAGTWCLEPTESLSPGQKAEIERIYQMYPQLTDDQFVSQHLDEWL